MKKITNITYYNKDFIGHFENEKYIPYTKEEKENLFLKIKNDVASKDYKRKLFSLIIAIILGISFLTLTILMIFKVINFGNDQWFNYIYLFLIFILLWIIIYFILGFIFYSKENIYFYFKGDKDYALNYASSSYYKWINKYISYLGYVTFKDENDKLITLGLATPKIYKNIIFNGKINSNIPYYYLAIKDKRIIFLPSFILFIDGKNSNVYPLSEINIKKDNDLIYLNNKEKTLLTLKVKGEFDINFFYFNY